MKTEKFNLHKSKITNRIRPPRYFMTGFTLIEILIALAVIAIAVTALLTAITHSTVYARRVQDKIISQWIAMDALHSIQLGLVNFESGNQASRATTLLGQKWFWRAEIIKSPFPYEQKIQIKMSQRSSGRFLTVLEGFRKIDERQI